MMKDSRQQLSFLTSLRKDLIPQVGLIIIERGYFTLIYKIYKIWCKISP